MQRTRAQPARNAAGGSEPTLGLQRRHPRTQPGERAIGAEAEQLLQARIGILHARAGRYAGDRVERAIALQQCAGLVEAQQTDRTQLEPVVKLASRAFGALIRRVLGAAILQRDERQRTAVGVEQQLARFARPVLATARVVPTVLVEHGSFGLFEPLPTARRAGRAALGFGSQVERIDADQLGAREAAQFSERAVHVLHAPVGAEQHRSERRLPRELQQLR